MHTRGRRNRRNNNLESLETRQMLAGDLVAQWQADSIEVADGNVSAWVDSISQLEAAVAGDPKVEVGLGGRSFVRLNPADGVDGFRISKTVSPMVNAGDFSIVVTYQAEAEQTGGMDEWFRNSALVDSSKLGFTTDWGLGINSAGRLSAGMGESFVVDAVTLYSDVADLNDDELHTATLVRGGGSLTLYSDGLPVGHTNDASKLARLNEDTVIGMSLAESNGFNGLLGGVRFYDGALTGQEVESINGDIVAYYNNEPPVAVADEYTLLEESIELVSAANGVLANDTDAEGDSLTVRLVDSPARGELEIREDGSFVYSPENNFFGIDSFSYVATDGQESEEVLVDLIVENKYDPAFAVGDSYGLRPGGVSTIPALVGVLANDLNPDRTELKAVLANDVGDGAFTLNSDGSFQYDSLDFVGTTSFTYQIDDGVRLSFATTVELIVNSVPVARGDMYALDEDSPLVVSAVDGVLSNDSDNENDHLTAHLIQPPNHGTLTLGPDGSFSYQPNAEFHGTDEFTYNVSDGNDSSTVATVRLEIEEVNDTPIAASDVYFADQNSNVEIRGENGVLRNDTDSDSESITAELTAATSSGALTFNADGSFSYTPNAGFVGEDSFRYVASDGNSRSAETEVSLFVGTSPIRISEFLAANVGGVPTRLRTTPDGRFRGAKSSYDWIELENSTVADFDIGGFGLADSPNDEPWVFPENTIVPGGGRLLVLASGLNIADARLDELGAYHTDFTLSIKPSSLLLRFPDGRAAQRIDYPAQVANVSFGPTTDNDFGFLMMATPGEPNVNQQFDEVVTPVDFSVDRGFYLETLEVGLSTETPEAGNSGLYDRRLSSHGKFGSCVHHAGIDFDNDHASRGCIPCRQRPFKCNDSFVLLLGGRN